MMLKELENLLRSNPNLKAGQIASRLSLEKKDVNRVLHENSFRFYKDSEYRWSVIDSKVLSLHFPDIKWIKASDFEKVLSTGNSPLSSPVESVILLFPKGCNIMIDALARILALCNQLTYLGKNVTLDFSVNLRMKSYLNRSGFFSLLSQKIKVLPDRPSICLADSFRGNNENLVEFDSIDTELENEDLPERLHASLMSIAGAGHASEANKAFTVIGELVSNVREHSKSPTHGFAGLQFYKGTRHHVQTVISDSGLGIVGTLRPILETKYPKLFSRLKASSFEFDVALLKEIFEKGKISQVHDEHRGQGLKASGEIAGKLNATINIRQKNFEVTFKYFEGKLVKFDHHVGLPQLDGTHICFDFFLA